MDLTRRPAGKWIVDFAWTMSAGAAALYEEPRERSSGGAAGGEVKAVVAGAPSWQSRQPALHGRTLDVTRDTRSRCMAGRRTPVSRITIGA